MMLEESSSDFAFKPHRFNALKRTIMHLTSTNETLRMQSDMLRERVKEMERAIGDVDRILSILRNIMAYIIRRQKSQYI